MIPDSHVPHKLEHPVEAQRTGSADPLLRVQGLTKNFGGLRAVDGVDFTVNRGEIVALIGPNGAGKTTTFNLLTGFARPDAGSVIFDGANITAHPPHQLARQGLVRSFQTAKLFPSMTVFEIIMTAALLRDNINSAEQKTRTILSQLHLQAQADRHADELSLPDRQMVELGKCLAVSPKMILLDEIMGGLNRGESHIPVEAIRRLRDKGMTFLLVEHVMPIVMSLADRIVVLDFGKKIAEGAPQDIVRNSAVQKSYLGGSVSDDS